MFEPVHGLAPKYTGQNRVNPIASIIAAAMMLNSLAKGNQQQKFEKAVIEVISEGKIRTAD